MEAKKYTFIEIFKATFSVADPDNGQIKERKINKIVIPMIQRDYAQGRNDETIEKKVRKPFLNALYRALTGEPITLDFVYGDLNDDGALTLLDGQQRLTTLFLLHWFAAKKENVVAGEYAFLKNFSYETRYSARSFCENLVDFTPLFCGALSSEIYDQNWFPYDWKNDPTVEAMLNMLDDIQKKFSDLPDIWQRMKNGAISFYCLPIDRMGLTDDLYIKMNSRGKPLTQFEHFKAEFERSLSEFLPKERVEEIVQKIDGVWTDLLWQYSGDDHLTDDRFLRYFHFICDIICYRNGGSPRGREWDEFDAIREYFDCSNAQASENVETAEAFFDCWLTASLGCTPKEFGKQIFSPFYMPDRVKYFQSDVFVFCLTFYGQASYSTIPRTLMLYAVVIYLLHKNEIERGVFVRRLRSVKNLIENSEYEMSDSETRDGGNRIPAILKQIDSIILNGVFLDVDKKEIEINFNAHQVQEEREKSAWTEKHPDLAESLFELEDNEILNGQIGIVGLENPEYFGRFNKLFQCDRDLVDCALLTCGNLRQSGKYGQLGTSAYNTTVWRNLFRRSQAARYAETKRVLGELLSQTREFTDKLLREKIDAYLTACEQSSVYDWRYYYIKYDVFRPGRYGRYEWQNFARPYEVTVIWAQKLKSENAYQPFLKALGVGKLSAADFGERLLLEGDRSVKCYQNKYVIYADSGNTEIVIAQNGNGIDTEDRILKMRKALQRGSGV